MINELENALLLVESRLQKLNEERTRTRIDYASDKNMINNFEEIKAAQYFNEWILMASQQENTRKIADWMLLSLRWPSTIISKFLRKISMKIPERSFHIEDLFFSLILIRNFRIPYSYSLLNVGGQGYQ